MGQQPNGPTVEVGHDDDPPRLLDDTADAL
jgi:hypothetical protein